ncbi:MULTISPECIES: LysR family transcriptional regulator [Pseudoxanthomonas]|uniref:LysR family transcriptional regulator n=1 Tax=Pseudoxanthomonas TaxID=83618 RepID=UPI00161B3E2D|nr:LysR family transcriptional regulator [Pseudoxanthomonas beigongshangi]MBB3275680.1 DNA-binding transcriptional LysR family regulator [Pseudoxanthomonas sp. OG2]MBD9377263.1 LysR family transcriptional regulator [Pseudoxanthomonas sp. PXM04]MBV7473235.1 LysR family transcriptional regulator [Pseudoxanthomonas sp. PXM05]UBB24587.1 LysR family transcriptional regulator [Pseudoxanthomonas japonensis]
MDTQFLNTFVTVVDRGSMAAAARELNITPAAVAQQIRTLERELGASLIARVGRTVSVTEEGSRIIQRARDLLRDVADMRSVANDSAVSGELRLGACPTALAGMLPDILARMVETFPQINVFIKPGYSADLYRAVESGELDAAIVLQAPFSLPKTCQWQLLREEPLVVLAPAAMAGRDPHELLATQPLIRYDRNQWGGRQADEYLRSAGIVPHERFELNALNAIAVMVDRGLGVSLVPNWARPWPEGLDLVRIPLPNECVPRRIGMVWSRSTVRIRLVTVLLQESQAVSQLS